MPHAGSSPKRTTSPPTDCGTRRDRPARPLPHHLQGVRDAHHPPFTPVPGGGFITAQELDGQFVVEGWRLNPAPNDSDAPCSQPVYHLIADGADEALTLIGEFATDLAQLIRNV